MTRSETIPSNHFLSLTAGVQAVYDSTAQLKYYRHADWLGSSWLQLNTDGTLHGDRAYAPYGEPYGETTTTADRSFTGQTSDTVTDTSLNGTTELYDFLYRQYSPTQGRWLAPDPAGLAAVDITNPQTWNRYAYVANNPLSNVDPLGLDCVYVTDTGRTSVIVGDCQSSTDDGYYVNGKVTNVTYDANTDHLSIAYNGNPGFVTFANAGFDDSSGSVGSGFFIGGGTVSANHGSVAQCLGEAAIDFGLDLTSLSMLPDANQDNWQWSSDKMGFIFAGTTASAGGFSTAVGVSEKASDWVKNTPAAQAEIRQFFRSQDVKISMKHVAKDAAFVGKWAGRAGAVLSVKAGYDRYQKCRGY